MISTYGTISARWKGKDFLITPTDVPRWDLQPEDIVQIKDGKREPGKIPSRTTYLHQEIYRRHPNINSIILTQTPYLMAFATTGSQLNVRTIPESWIFLQDVHSLEFNSHNYGRNDIIDRISLQTPAVLIQNDCVLVAGNQLLQTFDRLEVAEFSAKSLVLSSSLGKVVPISNEQVEELRAAFF
jgi:L-fuculose-phosphate aldolase